MHAPAETVLLRPMANGVESPAGREALEDRVETA